MAESWEISPDQLTLTFKLRQGVKWDSRAPTNGRALDAQDVIKSWEKFTPSTPASRATAYDATSAPTAPILSLTAPDNRTVVIKLQAAGRFGHSAARRHHVQPHAARV